MLWPWVKAPELEASVVPTSCPILSDFSWRLWAGPVPEVSSPGFCMLAVQLLVGEAGGGSPRVATNPTEAGSLWSQRPLSPRNGSTVLSLGSGGLCGMHYFAVSQIT